MSKIHEHEFINVNGVIFQRIEIEPKEDIPKYDIRHLSQQELENIDVQAKKLAHEWIDSGTAPSTEFMVTRK